MLTVQRPCLELTANRAGDVAARVAVTGGIVIPLWDAGSPKLDQKRVHEEEVYTYANPRGKVGGVQNIHNPSLEAHVPTPLHICLFILTPISQSTSCEEIFSSEQVLPGSDNGACVICVPGGGHVSIGVSGSTDLVPFFAGFGVATVILRPRLRGVPGSGIDGYNMTTDAVWDTQQAIRIVRAHAEEWGIDPRKIGVVGFSAGAELAAAAGLEYDAFDKVCVCVCECV